MFKKTMMSAAVAMTLALTACGSSGADSGADDQAIASLDSVAPSADDEGDAADGGDDAAPAAGGESAEEPSEAELQDAYEKYDQCLEDIGLGSMTGDGSGDGVATEVVVEDVDGGEDALSDDVFERMQQECDPLIADVVGEFELNPEQQAAQRDAELEFARCMREQGIDIPDPGGDDSLAFEIPDDFDPDQLNEIMDTCDSAFDQLNEQFEEEN